MTKYIFPIIIALLCINTNVKAQHRVNTHEGVKIGGIGQWIGAKSDDDTKPLLLFLHGGPGFSSRAYSKKFIKHLRKDFIVAQWDQRGTGITNAWGSGNDSLSLDLMHHDTKEVVDYLLKKFNKKKLYLVGYSWGGFLGLHFANEHPELLYAYISVSSMIHAKKQDFLTLTYIKEKASQSKNTQALEEIAKINIPFQSWEELYYQRKWTVYFTHMKTSDRQNPKSLYEDWSVKWMPIYLAASEVNYMETVPELHCPIYFFLSRKDLIANYTVAEAYFKALIAKDKQIIWFDESTHEIPTQEPKKFSEALIQISHGLN